MVMLTESASPDTTPALVKCLSATARRSGTCESSAAVAAVDCCRAESWLLALIHMAVTTPRASTRTALTAINGLVSERAAGNCCWGHDRDGSGCRLVNRKRVRLVEFGRHGSPWC